MHCTTVTLGRATARLQTHEQYAELLQNCFKAGIGQTTDFEVEQVGNELTDLIEDVIDQSYAQHSALAYVDAATLVSPKSTVLLVGASQRGKTTTSVALCLAGAAKFVCEDISLIDFSEEVILNMVAPFSIRTKTKTLFERHHLGTLPLVGDRWYPNRGLYIENDLSVKNGIALVFILMSPGSETEPLTTAEITADEAIKFLLPISNLLVHPEGCEKMLYLLRNAKVVALYAGSLEQRLQYIEAQLK
ncbi:MAG: hypothetical protein K2W95_36135 [Candidatus Obscuribacterales bacterium]|nr:hypothetical protein [Candidatus Obscuribacterales bacterium]